MAYHSYPHFEGIYFRIKSIGRFNSIDRIRVQRLNEKEGNVFVFSKELREKVFDTLENNSWSVHPRNLLLCMLLDANNEIKEKSIDIIKKSRSLPYSKELATIKPTRENHFKLNFDAICYHQIIDLDNELNFIEPPLTADIKIEYLNRFVCPKITNHTQIVEYFVQNVNKMSSKYGEDNRNSSIYVKETSKHLKDDQKTEFITKLNKKIQKANTCWPTRGYIQPLAMTRASSGRSISTSSQSGHPTKHLVESWLIRKHQHSTNSFIPVADLPPKNDQKISFLKKENNLDDIRKCIFCQTVTSHPSSNCMATSLKMKWKLIESTDICCRCLQGYHKPSKCISKKNAKIVED
ncbi:hypothetical protein BLOT_016640 [Blomia tropicalis]|nr:hypothetical protein BLOT_016640 [Blomia tropicalis]